MNDYAMRRGEGENEEVDYLRSIACGEFHSIFPLDDGRIFACGGYDSGQLGLDPGGVLAPIKNVHHPYVQTVPGQVRFPHPLRKWEKIIEVDSRRSMAWTESHLFAWGMGNVGELGLGPTVGEIFQPTLVEARPGQLQWAAQPRVIY